MLCPECCDLNVCHAGWRLHTRGCVHRDMFQTSFVSCMRRQMHVDQLVLAGP